MSEWVYAEGEMDIGTDTFGLNASANNAEAARRFKYDGWPWEVGDKDQLLMIPVEMCVRVAPWWVEAVKKAAARLEAGEDDNEVEEWLLNQINNNSESRS